MSQFSLKLNSVARDTNVYLKKIFLKKNKFSYLINPMQYSIFSGGKRFRSVVIVNTGKIFNIDYKKLIMIGAAIECKPYNEITTKNCKNYNEYIRSEQFAHH